MGNLYIALQNYDAAEKALAQIPEQAVSPQLLRNMISVHKSEYKAAEKAIHESVSTAMNEIIGQFGLMVVMREEEGKTEEVLALLRTQQRLYELFDLTSILGVGVVLQIALQLCEMKNNDEALDELEEAFSA